MVHFDQDLPYWVSTDHAVHGTFDNATDALALASRIVPTEREGERIFVTFAGVVVWTGRGEGSRS
jgi:hypothetical protein